jgi:tripartite-type tricarboxylate transporter receptor subunit TctC
MERFLYEAGVKIEHIPYKGSGQAKPALLGGQTETMVIALGSATSYRGASPYSGHSVCQTFTPGA